MINKTALICGVSGQDGSYLAKFLLAKRYRVWGSSRDAQGSNFSNLDRLGVKAEVQLISMIPEDFRRATMRHIPTRIAIWPT